MLDLGHGFEEYEADFAPSSAARCGRKKRAVRGRAGEKLRTAGPESRQWRVREEHF
jgi:hypothetical protein